VILFSQYLSCRICNCQLTAACCWDLSSVLGRSRQTLLKLELGWNKLGDSGVPLLCEELKHPNCKLQKLRLSSCDLTGSCCEDLSSVLSTNQTLKWLWLGGNKLGDSGVRQLCEGLMNPNCKLKKLWLSLCDFTGSCSEDLSSVLSTKQEWLWLDDNKLGDSGVRQLCEGLMNPNCKLQEPWLTKENFNEETWQMLKAVEEKKPGVVLLH
uniref:Uncharacterized protein n=1 Tax=Sphenodon punctatus TaxID=8508 RepID=A0A8D0GW26_SPHPU